MSVSATILERLESALYCLPPVGHHLKTVQSGKKHGTLFRMRVLKFTDFAKKNLEIRLPEAVGHPGYG